MLGYCKIREIIAILKNNLRAVPPAKKRKTTHEQATPTPLVQVRYLLVVPEDEDESQNFQWQFPKGQRNNHGGEVYCLSVPLTVCVTIIEIVSSFEFITSRYSEFTCNWECALSIALNVLDSCHYGLLPLFLILLFLSKLSANFICLGYGYLLTFLASLSPPTTVVNFLHPLSLLRLMHFFDIVLSSCLYHRR